MAFQTVPNRTMPAQAMTIPPGFQGSGMPAGTMMPAGMMNGGPRAGGDNPNATPACLDGTGPCGIAHLCFEPEGSMTNENWTYVGEGKGGYSKMQTYNYVGDGLGTFQKEVERADPGKTVKQVCQGFVGLVMLIGVCIILYSIFTATQDHGKTAEHSDSNQVVKATPVPASAGATTRAKPLFDCEEGYFNWNKAWDAEKQRYCCKQYNRGCTGGSTSTIQEPPPAAQPAQPPAQPQPQPPAPAQPAQPQYNCKDDSNWVEDWTVQQQAWCCKNFHKGCLMHASQDKAAQAVGQTPLQSPAGAPAPGPQALSPPLPPNAGRYDCHAGGDPWKNQWEVNKRVYCCMNFKIACPTKAPPARMALESISDVDAAVACNQPCTSNGVTQSCKAHIQFAAKHQYAEQPNACGNAQALVYTHCHACSSCSLKAAGCDNPQVPLRKLSTDTLPFDCEVGFSNFETQWTAAKKSWCCQTEKKGCVL